MATSIGSDLNLVFYNVCCFCIELQQLIDDENRCQP